ncbi:hypothetical protein ON011_003937 [Providencia rettgeri]|nr:hypothetical protein [Providencia rettgeri]
MIRHSAIVFIVVCWAFGAILAYCLPVMASVSTSNHATLIKDKLNAVNKVENKKVGSIKPHVKQTKLTDNSIDCNARVGKDMLKDDCQKASQETIAKSEQ